MAFGVTDDGFVLKDLATIRQEIDDEQRSTIDAGLDLSDRDPLGQVNAVISGSFAELWEVAQAVYNANYPDSASGSSLDNVASITGTVRSADTKTKVVGQVTLNPNTTLPIGSVANLASQPNARFLTTAEVTTVIGEVLDVEFEAETAGFIAVGIGQLSEIAEPVTGWTAVGNTAGATFQGSNTEDDPDLRVKRAAELKAGGSTSVDAIRANLIQNVAGVLDARVTEQLAAHTITCVLRGGVGVTIAQEIFDSRAAGIDTVGALSDVILDTQGIPHTIRYAFATELDFFATITVVVDPLVFDGSGGGETAIKAAMAAYINGLGIGQDVIYETVKASVIPVTIGCGVPGVLNVTACLIGFGVADTAADLAVDGTEVALADVDNITPTVA